MDAQQIFILVLVGICGVKNLELKTYSACYGVTLKNLILASCEEGEMIVIESLKSFAKPTSENCPETVTSSATPDSCCQYSEDDCGATYSGVSQSVYYNNCQGRTKCIGTPVAWQTTPCNSSIHMSRTNYMVLYYYCVEDTSVTSAGNGTKSGETVLLESGGYPLSSQNESVVQCAVEAECGTTIQIRALDLQMERLNNKCPHEIKLSTTGTDYRISCSDNETVANTLLFESNTPVLNIRLSSNSSESRFKYLFSITGADTNSTVTVTCNKKGIGVSTNPNKCSTTTEATTTTGVENLELKTYSACYGVTLKNLILASCEEGEMIVIESLKSFAKPTSDNCPETVTSSATPDSCCQYSKDDCGATYLGVSQSVYYNNCQGRTKCIGTPVAWQTTPCNSSIHMSRTNYMVLYYYCVEDTSVNSAGNDTKSGETVLLESGGYPLSSQNESVVECSVEAECGTTIQIRALDLQMERLNNKCPHEIKLSTTGTDYLISCSDNETVANTLLFESNTPVLNIRLSSNSSESRFKYLFSITGADTNSTVTVTCNKKGIGVSTNLNKCSTTTEATTTTEESNVILVGDKKTTNASKVTVRNPGYPSLDTLSSSVFSCVAQAECDTAMTVNGTFSMGTTSGGCKQYIEITDGTLKKAYTCTDSKIQYNSGKSRVLLKIVSNSPSNTAWFHIIFQGVDSTAFVNVVCDVKELSISSSSPPMCPEEKPNVILVGDKKTTNASEVTVRNPGYPSLDTLSSSVFSCVAQTDCDTAMTVNGTFSMGTTSGGCKQYIEITDGTLKREYTCADSKIEYNSGKSRVLLKIVSNSPSNKAWFHIKFRGVDSTASVTVVCDVKELSISSSTPRMCPAEVAHVILVGDKKTTDASKVTVRNPGYPSLDTPSSSVFSCVAQTDCDTAITVNGTFSMGTTSGGCKQYIEITDGTLKKEYTCADSKIQYSSGKSRVLLKIVSNSPSNKAWLNIDFQGVDSTASVTVVCDVKELSISSSIPEMCPAEATTKKPSTTEESSDVVKWVLPLVIILVVIVILVALLICLKRDTIKECFCKEKGEDLSSTQPFLKPNAIAPETPGILTSIATTSAAPVATSKMFKTAAGAAMLSTQIKKTKKKHKKKYKKKEEKLIRRESELKIQKEKLKKREEEFKSKEQNILLRSISNLFSSSSHGKYEVNPTTGVNEGGSTKAAAHKFLQALQDRKMGYNQNSFVETNVPSHGDENIFKTETPMNWNLGINTVGAMVKASRKFQAPLGQVCIDISDQDGGLMESTSYPGDSHFQ